MTHVKMNSFVFIAILRTIVQINELCWIELVGLNSNTCNHFTVWKQIINIKQNYYSLIEMLKTI